MARLALLLVLLAGCDAAPLQTACLPEVDPGCETPPEAEDIVAGVDLAALFAAPRAAEVDSAVARVPPPTEAEARLEALTAGPDGARRFLLVLSEPTDDGAGARLLTALVRVPGDASAATPLPVVVVLPDGTDGASPDDLLTGAGYGALPHRAIQVLVAYRGEGLTLDGETVRSERPAAPYRADVADVQAVVGALGAVPRAAPGRVGVVGLGRGGTVALLAAGALGDAVGAVVTLGAPTDLLAGSFADEVRSRLLDTAPEAPYPALDALAAPALAVRDGAATVAEARVGLLALSPARLRAATRLPPVLALHATGDVVVGDDQLRSLASRIARGTAELVPDQTHASLPLAPAVQSRVARFLLDTL